jgi:hypothetical protein
VMSFLWVLNKEFGITCLSVAPDSWFLYRNVFCVNTVAFLGLYRLYSIYTQKRLLCT